MSTFLYTLLGLTVGSTLHCAVRKEISPCTCRRQDVNGVLVTCERMSSFGQVVDALQDRFSAKESITLKVTFSSLEDLPYRNFQELNMSVHSLHLNHDNLRYVILFVKLINVLFRFIHILWNVREYFLTILKRVYSDFGIIYFILDFIRKIDLQCLNDLSPLYFSMSC